MTQNKSQSTSFLEIFWENILPYPSSLVMQCASGTILLVHCVYNILFAPILYILRDLLLPENVKVIPYN